MLSGADLTVLGLGVVWIGVGCLVSAVRTGGTDCSTTKPVARFVTHQDCNFEGWGCAMNNETTYALGVRLD